MSSFSPPSSEPEPSFTWSRRSFLQYLGLGALSVMAASGSSCRRLPRFIAPYKTAPEWSVPGLATYYATSWMSPWGALPLLATTYEGRPTLLEGISPNKDLKTSFQGCPPQAIAQLWELYNPERSQSFLRWGKKVGPRELTPLKELEGAFRAWSKKMKSQSPMAFVLGASVSPTEELLLKKLKSLNSHLELYRHEPVAPTQPLGTRLLQALGQAPTPENYSLEVNWQKAKVILSLEADFLGLAPCGQTRGFYEQRGGEPSLPDEKKAPQACPGNRLYCVQSSPTLTGGMADHYLALPPQEIEDFLLCLSFQLKELLGKKGTFPSELEARWAEMATHFPTQDWVRACAKDLLQAQGKSLILAGKSLGERAAELVFLLNKALGALAGASPLIRYITRDRLPTKTLASLPKDLKTKNFELLLWASPALPSAEDFPLSAQKELFESSDIETLHWGLSALGWASHFTWHLPASHFLESWGDGWGWGHTLCWTQPLLEPLSPYSCSLLELFLGLLSPSGSLRTTQNSPQSISPAYFSVKSHAENLFKKEALFPSLSPAEAWTQCLKEGFLCLPSHLETQLFFSSSSLSPSEKNLLQQVIEETLPLRQPSVPDKKSPPSPFVLHFRLSPHLWDGRFIDNPWLQELPDPFSQEVWGNAALLSESTAKALLEGQDPTKLQSLHFKIADQELTLPVLLLPGIAPGVITLTLGYGQKDCGLVGQNIGVCVDSLQKSTSLWQFVELNQEVFPSLLPRQENIALAQSPPPPEPKRKEKSVLYGTLSNPAPRAPLKGQDPLHQWGMVIDLSKCTGCQSCVIACLAENNIPLVGKEQAQKERLMHWLHIDRFFASEASSTPLPYEPFFSFLPRACQQCQNAPCESVCPMAATAHTTDGLNAMAYSRCVGTRYCATNCPYQARRFNYLDYNKKNPYIAGNLEKGADAILQVGAPPHLQRNPRVTVRMRGVMEKCTYCVQRIEAAKQAQKQAFRERCQKKGLDSLQTSVLESDLQVPESSVRCACQMACPAGAISLGNLALQEKSCLSPLRESPFFYTLLDHLPTEPRTGYLTQRKNPHLSLPSFLEIPFSL